MLLKNKLKNLNLSLKSNNVLTTLEERYCYSIDASNSKIAVKVPDLVVFVENTKQVQELLKYASLHNIPIVPRGAGTNMVGACACTHGGIVINFSKMNKILKIDSTNMTAVVQPGVILGDLKEAVEKFNLFYPPDPSNYKVSTIGGSIAQSSGGAKSFKYGTTKDYVLSLKVVTADGNLIELGSETAKDASGYHLSQLIVGSEGTLGIIIEATLKLIPKPEESCLVCAYFNSVKNTVSAVNRLITKNIYPAAIDFMDKNSIKTVNEYTKSSLKSDYEAMLIIELDGDIKSTFYQTEKCADILKESQPSIVEIKTNQIEIQEIWDARRASYAATCQLAPDVLSDDLIVPRYNLEQMINICEQIRNKYDLKMCLVGHVGDGNIHPQIALDLNNDNEFKNYISAKSELYKAVTDLGGTISAEHGIGIEKLSFLENTIDKGALKYMKLIKKAFDPQNILNPGKIFKL